MKTLATALTALTVLASASTFAADSKKEVRFEGDKKFAGFCKAAVKDDVRILRSTLARNVGSVGASQREVLRLVTAEGGMTCNGENLVKFAKERNADAVVEYIAQRS